MATTKLGYPATYTKPARSRITRIIDRESLTRRFDWVLFASALLLSIIGAVLVYSATRNVLPGQDPTAYLKRHVINLVLGICLGGMTAWFDYRQLRAYAPIVYVLSILGLIAVLSPLGYTMNGAHAWIQLPAGFSVQPSEFAKVALVVGLAMLLSERRDAQTEPMGRDVLLALGIAAVPLLLVMLQPDLGTAAVMGMIVLGILTVAGTRTSWLLGLVGVVVLGVFVALQVHFFSQYQIDRLLAFSNPHLDPSGVGYNTTQARIAVGSGGLFGVGLFHGSQTNGQFVPAQETDFIFTVAGEELGFVGSAVIVGLFALILWRAMRIAMRAQDLFGTLVATGVICWFTFQMFENIGMVLNIMPVTGVPLPFISYGGSSMFANWMAIGLLENIHLRRAIR